MDYEEHKSADYWRDFDEAERISKLTTYGNEEEEREA